MTPERWEKVGEIFNSASELDTAERDAYLNNVCADDPTLLAEVKSLLMAGNDAAQFISKPIVGKFVPDFADHIKALSPGSTVGHYTIKKAIGSGGMGEVYLATDTVLGRRVAIKTLPPALASDPTFLRRFRNEAQAAANINHPNVATVHSVENVDGLQFITMEYVDGETLDRLTPEGGLELKTFLAWLEPIADALCAAHKRGVIHRDIKPGNIMISADGTPKILDFGLAQVESSIAGNGRSNEITAPGQIIGTPSYMSPEQAEGADMDARSDIFSFGTVMYEALTGKRPFRGATQGLIVRAVVHDIPEPIAKQRPEVPSVIAKMIARCLKKSPGKRFQSMREVHSILKEARTASDAGVSMDTFARRFYREAASSPSKLWWVATATLVLVLSVGGWYFISNSNQRSPISMDRVSMRRLSQSNNVAYTTITPDGKSVAYVTLEENGDRALWLRRVSDSNAIQIVPPQAVQYWGWPTFSQDGEHLYYLMAARTDTHGTVYRVPTLGGTPRKIVERVNHLGNISPDGSRIIFVRYGETNPNTSVNTAEAKIISADSADGGNEQVLKAASGETIFRDPQFTKTGEWFAYVKRELSGGVEFWSIASSPIAGGEEKEIIRQKERIAAIAVLGSDGLVMNALDPVSNLHQLFHVDLGNGTTTRVTNDLNFYFGVSVDREGRTVVTSQRSGENRIWIGDAEGMPSLKPINVDPPVYQAVDWTPDGRIVYDAHENNRIHIWIADADGRNSVQLTSSNSDDSEPKVSGDGRHIVFTSRRAGYNQIWRMNIDGSGQMLLADVPGITQRPRVAADGQTVVFRWFNQGSSPLGKVSINGGAVEGINGLPESVSYFWAMSPDAKYIAYSTIKGTNGPSNIDIRPVDSPEPIASHSVWLSRLFKWLPDSRRLIYQDPREASFPQSKLTQIDALTGQTKPFISVEPDEIFDLTFSRDAKRIAIIRGKTVSDAVILSTNEPVKN